MNIKPISDLRNYNNVLKDCFVNSPIFLTKNGRGKYVIMDMKEYEQLVSEIKLINKINQAEQRIADGEKYMTVNELREKIDI